MIVASNGMLTGGRVVGHLRNLIDDPRAVILFVGYQGQGTLGAHLQQGATTVKLDGQVRTVRCQVRSISGFSAHADESELLDWLANFGRGKAAGDAGLPAAGLPRPRRPRRAGGPGAEGRRRSASRSRSRTGTRRSSWADSRATGRPWRRGGSRGCGWDPDLRVMLAIPRDGLSFLATDPLTSGAGLRGVQRQDVRITLQPAETTGVVRTGARRPVARRLRTLLLAGAITAGGAAVVGSTIGALAPSTGDGRPLERPRSTRLPGCPGRAGLARPLAVVASPRTRGVPD